MRNARKHSLLLTMAGCAALVAAGCGSSSSSSSAPKTGTATANSKKLSQSSVTIDAGATADSALVYVAQAAGYFKDEGLTVKIVDTSSSASTTDIIAGLISNSYTAINSGATTAILADQKSGGNAIQAVFQMDQGSIQQIAITNSKAKAINLPTSDGTPAGALKQFMALKGSHLAVAVTSLTSISTVDLEAACNAHGLTCQPNSKSADVDIQTAGTDTVQIAGFRSGRFDALIASPPVTTQPDSTPLDLGMITPVSSAVNDYLMETPSFIKAHPDTTQALINAMTMSWNLAHTNPTQALTLAHSMYEQEALTDPTQEKQVFDAWKANWLTPIPSEAAYNNTVGVVNGSQTTKITVPFSQFADTTFAENAVRQQGIKVPS